MRLLRIYHCLSDATRLRILSLLAQRPLCVCHFEGALRLPQPRISRHLAYLRRHGMVTSRQNGPWRIYALASPAPAVLTANLACVQEARGAEPVLQRDLNRLQKIAAESAGGCTVPAAPRRQFLRLARRA